MQSNRYSGQILNKLEIFFDRFWKNTQI